MSARMQVPLGQRRHTNVAVVRLTRNGIRLEIACYKNKVVSYRNGEETRLDEVLQVDRVFTNVSRGLYASLEEMNQCFGHPIATGGAVNGGDGGKHGKKGGCGGGGRAKGRGERRVATDSDDEDGNGPNDRDKDGNASLEMDTRRRKKEGRRAQRCGKGRKGSGCDDAADFNDDKGNNGDRTSICNSVCSSSNVGSTHFAAGGKRGDEGNGGDGDSEIARVRTEKDAVVYILKFGELQVAQQERCIEESETFKAIAFSIAEKCVNKHTNRPFPPAMIEQALKTLGVSVRHDQNMKKHVLQFITALCESQVIPVARAPMKVRCTVPLVASGAPATQDERDSAALILEWCQANGAQILDKSVVTVSGETNATNAPRVSSDDESASESDADATPAFSEGRKAGNFDPAMGESGAAATATTLASPKSTTATGTGNEFSVVIVIQPPLYRALDDLIKKMFRGKGSLHVVESAVINAGVGDVAVVFTPSAVAEANSDLREYTTAAPSPRKETGSGRGMMKEKEEGKTSRKKKVAKACRRDVSEGSSSGGENSKRVDEVEVVDPNLLSNGCHLSGTQLKWASVSDAVPSLTNEAVDDDNSDDDGKRGGRKGRKGKRGAKGVVGVDAGMGGHPPKTLTKQQKAKRKEESGPESDEEILVNRKQRKQAAAAAAAALSNDGNGNTTKKMNNNKYKWDDCMGDDEDYDYGDEEEGDGL